MTQFLERMYGKFAWVNVNTGLLFLRLGLGSIFIMTGLMKMTDMHSTVMFFADLGFNAFWAYLVTFVELLGGISIVIGLGVYSRVAAKLLCIVMLVVIYLAHANFAMMLGPIALLFMTLSLICTGPGKYSIMREGTGQLSA